MNGNWTWAQTKRRRTVEVLACWRGWINTTELMARFGISRPAALQDIHAYLDAVPGNLVYRPSLKAYVPSAAFRTSLSRGEIGEWLELESGMSLEVAKPRFEVAPALARPLGEAVRHDLGVDALYRSLNHPAGSRRTLYPHAFVYTGFRWHLRAWCATRHAFRDFTVARLVEATCVPGPRPAEADPANDVAWHAEITLRFAPNPHLTEAERALIEAEFGMRGGVLEVPCRGAIAQYTLQTYQVDPQASEANLTHARHHRLVLANRNEIEAWLWDRADQAGESDGSL